MAPKAKRKSKPAPAAVSQPVAAAAKGDVQKSSAAAAGTPTGPSIEELFKTLDRHVRADDFRDVVKVADQILQLSPGDKDTIECKAVAYIQLDEFDRALSVIETAPDIDLTFQQAYCLYKRNRIEEALACLKGVERDAKILQLEAQILFKLGDFSSCINCYQKLLQNHKDNSDEVKSNIIAAYVSGGRSQEVQAAMESLKVNARSNFNVAYNAGCALIEKDELSKAEEHFLLARRIGQEALIEEECPEDEIEDELAPISVQLSYVHQVNPTVGVDMAEFLSNVSMDEYVIQLEPKDRKVQGHSAEAFEGYNTLIKRKPADESSMAIASNNLIALRGARDLFDALKKFDKLFEKKTDGQRLQLTEKLEQRLSSRQKEAICFNRLLLLLHSNKLDQARVLIPSLLVTYQESELPPILGAALALKEGKPARAEDALEEYATKHSKNSTPVFLIQAQVMASSGNFGRAADCLEKIVELQHRPGMVATLVALRERAGDVDRAEAVLDAAVEWWENHMGDESDTLEELTQEAASFKLKHNKLDAASELFQRLSRSSSAAVRAEALNGLVRSTAFSDPSRAELFEKQLPPLAGIRSVDMEVLERAAPTSSKRTRGVGEETKTGDERVEKHKPKKKRKRKPLYPKNFDPANPGPPPDPERWLPKRERSTFRAKKKDKRASQQIRGAQGSVSRDRIVDVASNGPHSSSGQASSKGGSNSASSVQKSSVTASEPSKPSGGMSKNKKKGRR